MERANTQALAFERNLKAIHTTAMAMPPVMPQMLPPTGQRLPGGGSGGGRTSGGHGGGGLHGGNIHAGAGGFGIGSVGMGLAGEAMVPLMVAATGIYMAHGAYEATKTLQMAQADFSKMNLGDAKNNEATAKAWALTSGVKGSKVAENLSLIHDLHTATGDFEHAIEMSDDYTKYSVAAKVQNHGENVEGLVMDSVKALEHRGDRVMQNSDARHRELQMQSQVNFFTRGQVSAKDYFDMSKTGGMAYQMASADYLYGPAAALISANTGNTAGTMEMTALSSLIGGHMDKKAKGFLSGLGLWNETVDPKVAAMRKKFANDPEYQKIVAANGGSLIQTGGLSGADAALFASDRNSFVETRLVPAIRKRYGLNLTDEQVNLLVTANFNRGTSKDLGFFITNQKKITKDTAGIRRGEGFEEAYDSYMKTSGGAEENFIAAWGNFKTEFGKSVLPGITSMLNTGADFLRGITDFMQKNEALFSGLGKILSATHGGTGLPGSLVAGVWRVATGGSFADPSAVDPVAKPKDKPAETHVDVHLDGQKIAAVVAKHQAVILARPQPGNGRFDMGVLPISGGMVTR